MINLPDVTMLAICCDNRVEGTIKALEYSCREIDFGAIKFISDKKPDKLPDYITWEECTPIKSTYDFDVYSVEHMWKHLKTSHALYCQDHGFVINPQCWTDEFLEFSFLGSPWPIRPEFISVSTGEMVRVGNGGFSLRSKELLELPHKLGLHVVYDRGYSSDDGLVNSYFRKIFRDNGIKYAPVELAAKFAFENLVAENVGVESLGFHRYRNPTVK
jgi:hypothetical protein